MEYDVALLLQYKQQRFEATLFFLKTEDSVDDAIASADYLLDRLHTITEPME